MKNYTITVNGNVYDVTVEENGSGAPAAAAPRAAAPKAAPALPLAPPEPPSALLLLVLPPEALLKYSPLP